MKMKSSPASNCLTPARRLVAVSLRALLVLGLLGHRWPFEVCVQAQTSFANLTQALEPQQQPQQQAQQQVELVDSYPYYIKSPLVSQQERPELAIQQRSNIPVGPETGGSTPSQGASGASGSGSASNTGRLGPVLVTQLQPQPQLQLAPQQPPPPVPLQQPQAQCLYDKRYFLQLDQCLERKPYPIVGLPAFRNDDLLIKKGLSDKYGCSFILTNGLFKNYLISKYSLDSDTQCLDQDKTSQLSIQFSNVTLYYLWQLRCLNYADQLLDDATLGGRTLLQPSDIAGSGGGNSAGAQNSASSHRGICVGSSQNFGFASLQLANIEAQVELSIDIYKNWRVTNVTLALASHLQGKQEHGDYAAQHESQGQQSSQATGHQQHGAAGIRDFTFETLDGDELNWRYLHLYDNWTRNRLHVNFLDQFRRFLWVSLQRCLSESSEKLPVKLVDIFGHHKYN